MFSDKKTLVLGIILILEIFLTVTLFSEEYIYGQWKKEEVYQINEFGDTAVNHAKTVSSSMYDKLFIETGFAKSVVELFIPNEKERENSKGLEKLGNSFFFYASNRMIIFWDGIYQAMFRFYLILEYMPLILPLLVPGIVEGLMRREVKKRNYGYASSVRFTFSMQIVFIMLLLIPIYLFIPIAIAPKIILFCGYLIVFMSILMTSNLQKQI